MISLQLATRQPIVPIHKLLLAMTASSSNYTVLFAESIGGSFCGKLQQMFTSVDFFSRAQFVPIQQNVLRRTAHM